MTRRHPTVAVLAVLAVAVLAGCASAPPGERNLAGEFPLAAAHSDMSFLLTTGTRQGTATPPTPFAAQVQRVAGALQSGARALYPEFSPRAPGIAVRGFDIHVVDGEAPGSVSSASGRIALNAALGAHQPYDDWLAFVIAREMGHVIARHHQENSSASITISVIMNVLLPGSGLLKSAVSALGTEIAVGSRREQQARQADAIAIRLLQAAGYDLRNVALSLVVAPESADARSWSLEFRKSSEWLIAGVRDATFAGVNGIGKRSILADAGRYR